MYEYVQIFVISNGTNTKYYSNSTRYNAIKDAKHGKMKKEKTSNSFEFTSYWADANNRVLTDLIDFTRTFFAKHTILSVLTRYCIFTSEKMLMVMRPYQITATERILNRIEIANNYKKYGSIEGGGYIWHTTGSGKTLTSFKTARLASQLPYIDKVLFVVDRKDLDYQTMKEYDRFEKGAANSNTSTTILKRQLENPEAHIIITTIQKLATFIKKNPGHEVYQKHVVIIFDECHRSQFGDMHKAIVHNFKNTTCSALLERRFLQSMQELLLTHVILPRHRPLATSCILIPSWMPSMIRMCCRSVWTTSRRWTQSRTWTINRFGTLTGKRRSWLPSAFRW